jgi:hypothetical protein
VGAQTQQQRISLFQHMGQWARSTRMHTQRVISAVKAPEWPLEANGQKIDPGNQFSDVFFGLESFGLIAHGQ